MPASPQYRHRNRQRAIHKPPKAIAAKAAVGIAGDSVTAPVHPDTVLATPIMTSTPHPIGVSAAASKPKSISRKAATAQGITHNAVTGTAMRLAARP